MSDSEKTLLRLAVKGLGSAGLLAVTGSFIWWAYEMAQDGLTSGELLGIGMSLIAGALVVLIFFVLENPSGQTMYGVLKEEFNNE